MKKYNLKNNKYKMILKFDKFLNESDFGKQIISKEKKDIDKIDKEIDDITLDIKKKQLIKLKERQKNIKSNTNDEQNSNNID